MDKETIKQVQRILEDYVDDLRKSNDLWRKSQGEIADMILDKLQDIKTKSLSKTSHNKSFTVTKDKPSPPKFCPHCGGRDFVPIRDSKNGQCLGCGFIGEGKTSSER